MGDLLVVNGGARAAWTFLPNAAPADTVWLGPTGEVLRVDEHGHLEFVVTAGQPWHRSAAASPDPRWEAR